MSGASRIFNNAAGQQGGVIFCGDEVTNLTFTGATGITGNRARDGGVLASNGVVSGMRVEGASDVSTNSASERAGAVFAGELQLTLTGGSSMRGHTANWGGSIYVQSALRSLVISGASTLSGSKAGEFGGAIYIFGGGASSTNTSINSTSGNGTAAGGERFGGASNVLIAEGSNVTDVAAGGSGGEHFLQVGGTSPGDACWGRCLGPVRGAVRSMRGIYL